jgi:hypothetical protein
VARLMGLRLSKGCGSQHVMFKVKTVPIWTDPSCSLYWSTMNPVTHC